jgi:DNA-binding GntR family transcriptional regulator
MALVESQIISSLTRDQGYELARRTRAVLIDQQLAFERQDWRQVAEADADFHRLVCSTARNSVLRTLGHALIDHLSSARLALFSIPENVERSLASHERIIQALASGNLQQAAEIDRAHHIEPNRFPQPEAQTMSGETVSAGPS